MHVLEPDMVLGKQAVDGAGIPLGEIVDVGLFAHNRVRFLVVQADAERAPMRRVEVEKVESISDSSVILRG